MRKTGWMMCSLSLALAACASHTPRGEHAAPDDVAVLAAAESVVQAATAAADDAALRSAVENTDLRTPANLARDAWRHPYETLGFFQVRPDTRVVEITPGGGWYTEILAPLVQGNGHYTAALVDPAKVPFGAPRDFQLKQRDTFWRFMAGKPDALKHLDQLWFDPSAPVFAEPGSVDTILTFRNVHNWVAAGTAQKYFDAFFAALKPGGVLGVVDHRAQPGTGLEAMKASGYLTEDLVIGYAKQAGFVLEARAEINANPRDNKDHPNGVWTLPPTNRHDAKDDAKYKAIGESDRMTLRFRKP